MEFTFENAVFDADAVAVADSLNAAEASAG